MLHCRVCRTGLLRIGSKRWFNHDHLKLYPNLYALSQYYHLSGFRCIFLDDFEYCTYSLSHGIIDNWSKFFESYAVSIGKLRVTDCVAEDGGAPPKEGGVCLPLKFSDGADLHVWSGRNATEEQKEIEPIYSVLRFLGTPLRL